MSLRKLWIPAALVFAVVIAGGIMAFADDEEGKTESSEHSADGTEGATQHIMLTNDALQWMEGPPSLPAGAEVAMLEGDATKEGSFTLRLKLPANYEIPPHWHPADEHVTVLDGNLWMAGGSVVDRTKGTKLGDGGFAVMPAKFPHHAWTGIGGATIQLHGMGPWGINYVNPNDDPRNRAVPK